MFVRHCRATLIFREGPHARGALWILKSGLRVGAVVVLVQRLPLFRPVGFIWILVHGIPVAVSAVAEAGEGGEDSTVVLSRPRSIPRGRVMIRAAGSARSGGGVAASPCGAGRSGGAEGCDSDHGDGNRFHGFHRP